MRSRQISWFIVTAVASLSTANASAAQTNEGQALLPAKPIPLVEQLLVPLLWPPDTDPSELARRMAALEEWVREYSEWKEWETRWQGKLEPGLFGPRERRRKPDPPAWLFSDCRNLVGAEGLLADACQLLGEWQEDYSAAQVRAKILAGRSEQDVYTKWWNHLHIDALWVTPNVPASYGLVGVHATLKVAGRWQVFIAPGVIFLNVPTSSSTRAWVPATDLGISYRLFDLTLPGTRREGTLHLNLARAWILGQSGSVVASTVDLAGFSLTLK